MNDTARQRAEQIVQATHLLFATGVMSHSGHANLSARLPDETDQMLLTARGTVRKVSVEDLAIVTFAGQDIEGQLEPTAREIVAMHAAVYRTRPDVGAVIHTHSPHVTSFALAHRPLPCAYEALLRFGVTEDIPVASSGGVGTTRFARVG